MPEAVVESVVHKRLSFFFLHPVQSPAPQLYPGQDLPLTAAAVPLPISQFHLF